MGASSLPTTVARQRRGCDLNPGPSAPESRGRMHDAGVSYSLGVSPTSVVVNLGLATYARRYACRRCHV